MSSYDARRKARTEERYASPRWPAGPEPRTPRPGPSAYEKRYEREPQRADWPTYRANVMGQVMDVPVCCLDPTKCTRDECWTPLRVIG